MGKYEEAIALFEACDYDGAVSCFIDAYNDGIYQEEIITDLYNCFILPNEQEFRENYENNKTDVFVDYDMLLIDFIPVTESKFYLYHRKDKSFLGYIDLQKRYPQSREKEVDSLLITDVWDIREMLDVMYLKRWEHIYVIPGKDSELFMSFYKLPQICSLYMKNVTFFTDAQALEDYFSANMNVYLPRTVVGENIDFYKTIIGRIHEDRIHNMDACERDNILLSICIPTYERGDKALKNVETILRSEYDAEIEIIVSNNGSKINAEGYEKIREIKDSRLVYFTFDENQGANKNIINVLSLAKGRFAVLDSDEDVIILENLGKYLKLLMNHLDSGIVLSGGYGDNFGNVPYTCETGYSALITGLNTNYITGITYNLVMMQEEKFIQKCEELSSNLFFEYYPHVVLSVMHCEKGDAVKSGIILWDAREDVYCDIPDLELPLKRYMHPNIRIRQQNSCIELLNKILDLSAEWFADLFYERVWKTYFLLELACEQRTKAFCSEYRWLDVCLLLYKNNKKLIDKYRLYIGEELAQALNICCDNVFLEEISKNPASHLQDKLEQTRQQLLADLLKYYYQIGKNFQDISLNDLEVWVERGREL